MLYHLPHIAKRVGVSLSAEKHKCQLGQDEHNDRPEVGLYQITNSAFHGASCNSRRSSIVLRGYLVLQSFRREARKSRRHS